MIIDKNTKSYLTALYPPSEPYHLFQNRHFKESLQIHVI